MNISYLKLEEENKLFLLKYLLLQSLKIFKSQNGIISPWMGSAIIMDIVIFCIRHFSEKIPRIQNLETEQLFTTWSWINVFVSILHLNLSAINRVRYITVIRVCFHLTIISTSAPWFNVTGGDKLPGCMVICLRDPARGEQTTAAQVKQTTVLTLHDQRTI